MGAFAGALSGGPDMALTDTTIRAAKPKERDYKLADGGGLYLLVMKAGGQALAVEVPFAWRRAEADAGEVSRRDAGSGPQGEG